MELAVAPEDVEKAAARIRNFVRRTPVETSRSANFLADPQGATHIYFKCENLQRGGSFKIRGASNRILSIPDADRSRGIVAFSSGNHAQATAIVAGQLGIAATIVMPHDAPRSKMDATRDRGARIVVYDRFREDREQVADQVLRETGATLVPPFDDPQIIAGQGTCALELMEDTPQLDGLIVCVGGGGLISGSATIARWRNPSIRIFGAEPERASDVYQSLRAGHRITIDAPDTIADGLRTLSPGRLTFPIIQRQVEKILLVTEDEIRETVRFFLLRMKLLVEPSGAVGAAAAMFGKFPPELRSIGVIISGGNVDLSFLKTLA